jgi:glycerophosphoryl diester phosphodiesterase
MKFKTSILTALILLLSVTAFSQTKVIAHRGFWKTAGSAQNSLTSLNKADSINCFGSEFDIWITTDNVLMVNHDASYKGVTLETSKYCDLKNLTLANGEKLPTLKSYFKKAKKLNVNLICEIKTHNDINRQNTCIDAALKMAKKMKLENRLTYIAFSLDAVKRLIEKAPKGTEVYYLNGELDPASLKSIGSAGPDYEQTVMKNHPEWIEECHKLGMKVNVWTVNKAADMQFFIDKGVDFITTNEPVLLQSLVKK